MPRKRRSTKREDALEPYRRRRDFRRTPEPRGTKRARASRKRPRFVVQKHDAGRLHYDFRLEVGGVLRSWAVPKGPSPDPAERRLALPTEDHPLAYADFEGVIPEGEYGAGTVLVWDAGTYRNLDGGRSVAEGLKDGHVEFVLEGSKLKGGWALTRIAAGKDERWLLVKMDDDFASPGSDVLRARPESVLTGRTLAEVAREARGD